ncbi:MAG: tRNA 2-thiouridine(34) synthase MnmA [Gammaproteobacteria bacterium]|nr:tRNA 2-thiouridine(34) synthase MnmA [Gammaproteobacteria bacterium]
MITEERGVTQREKVVIGLSGGVDSSVATLLLQQQGYHLQALFMKNWEEDDHEGYCAAAEDLGDATAVADRLGVELTTMNFATEYWDRVFTNFLSEYAAGRTPNPDILCNREIKFRAFLDHALDQGADYIATGHYARIRQHRGEMQLLRGIDPNKDQSYFLYTLNQHQLSHALFPLGSLDKREVRRLAAAAGLTTHNKKDSTGICFIGERRFRDFLERYLPAKPGKMVTPEGREIGTHSGLMYYTLGQRQGLGIGGVKGYPEEPWFVLAKDLPQNKLVVGQGHHHPLLLSSELFADTLHWISGTPPDSEEEGLTAQIRYRQTAQPCRLQWQGDDQMRLEFSQPQWAITPGQSVVIYRNQQCLGGGVIH